MNIQFKNNFAILAIFSALAFISSCKDKTPNPEDQPENESELITTMIAEFTDSASSATTYAIFRDADGEGGNKPSRFDTISLNPLRTYYTRIFLLDESKSPADSISNEVLEEADDHLFVFTPSSADLRITITDRDSKQFPLGLESTWKTGAASNGTIRITLKHQPGVKNGTPDPGETDLDLTFHYKVQ